MSDFRVESVSNETQDAGIQPSAACKIRVLGIGGGGGNTLQHMINESLSGVEFIAINTDSQALNKTTAPLKVQIGVKLTGGLGAGCDPNKGRKAAEESKDDIKKLLSGSDMVFIAAGMGGGTGTGAAPVIAEIAKESGALTVAVVTKPFKFEGSRHMVNAESGISELQKHVDSLIVIDNEKLLKNLGANISLVNAFSAANDVLLNAVRGITDCITNTGFINVDFADVQTVMRGRGHAMIGTGEGAGANFVEDAVERAIHSPLIEPIDIQAAAGLLVVVRANPNFPINRYEEICSAVQAYADPEADCKVGLTYDESMSEDAVSITILITGISAGDLETPSTEANKGRAPDPVAVKTKGWYQAGLAMRDGRRPETNMNSSKGVSSSTFTVTDASSVQGMGTDRNSSVPSSSPIGGFSARDVETQYRPHVNEVQGRDMASTISESSSLWDDLPPIIRNRAE